MVRFLNGVEDELVGHEQAFEPGAGQDRAHVGVLNLEECLNALDLVCYGKPSILLDVKDG